MSFRSNETLCQDRENISFACNWVLFSVEKIHYMLTHQQTGL